jgi:hypothetical protein
MSGFGQPGVMLLLHKEQRSHDHQALSCKLASPTLIHTSRSPSPWLSPSPLPPPPPPAHTASVHIVAATNRPAVAHSANWQPTRPTGEPQSKGCCSCCHGSRAKAH